MCIENKLSSLYIPSKIQNLKGLETILKIYIHMYNNWVFSS